MKIVLASASPRRRDLLTLAGYTFDILPAGGEEKSARTEPDYLVEDLSGKKAWEIFDKIKNNGQETVVIGADTIVSYRGEILGKPGGDKEAKAMLGRLQGRVHQVYTGVTLLGQALGGRTEPLCITFHEKTEVELLPMREEEIAAYVRTGEPMDKAGAYGIQGCFAVYIKGIVGDYYNVVGLPLARLHAALKEMKIALEEEKGGKR